METPQKNSVDPELAAECAKLGMSPPAKEGVHLSLASIMHAIAEDGFESHLSNPASSKALIYLYGRSFFSGKFTETKRKTEVSMILADDRTMTRLNTVLNHTDDTEDVGNAADLFYSEWLGAVSAWEFQDGAFIVFDNKVTIKLRKQLSSNCFLHAPVVLHGYLINKATGEFKGMVDLTRFVRHFFSDETFSRFVVHDLGGDSLDILESLVGYSNFFTLSPSRKWTAAEFASRVVKNVKQYGPALLCRFMIDHSMTSFQQPRNEPCLIPLFDEYVPAEKDRPHAMVLVGYRDNDTGDGFNFLLQNWWTGLQFLEITDEFLMKSKAKIVWLTEPVEHFDSDHPVNMYRVAEAHILEGEDSLRPGSEKKTL